MRVILMMLIAGFFAAQAGAQNTALESKPDPKKKLLLVEASCGECNFKMTGKGCNLAVRMDGKSYYVDNTKIDEHGDAHADDGFCAVIRKAEVQGEVVDNRFKATYFKLKPLKEEKN